MKIKARHLLITGILSGALATNPNTADHNHQILKGQKTLDVNQEAEFIQSCETHDYKLFSFVTYMGLPVSIGVLGNVHILFSNLSRAMTDYINKKGLRQDNDRGSPPSAFN